MQRYLLLSSNLVFCFNATENFTQMESLLQRNISVQYQENTSARLLGLMISFRSCTIVNVSVSQKGDYDSEFLLDETSSFFLNKESSRKTLYFTNRLVNNWLVEIHHYLA